MHFSSFLVAAVALLPAAVLGQLSGKVGPLTTHAAKSKVKTCSVLDYGGKADKSTDIGPALLKAFAACKTGGTVVVPAGDYAMQTWATFEGGKAWALQLDGVIYRTGTGGGNMIFIRNANDFEMFSSTGKGAVQGLGYQDHRNGKRNGARLLRVEKTDNFSVHDILLVDAPMFHFVMNTVTNGEAYNMVIRGGDWGGLDGVDVVGTNVWIHDIAVTNKDECVTVKSPSTNLLIENIHCNISGGCGMGSLGVDTAISKIRYKNVYTWRSNQMMMIKSNGGSGIVEDVVFENFIGHENAYAFNIDQYWASMAALAGSGVSLSNISATNWRGVQANGAQRGPVKVVCADGAPCTDVNVQDVRMWTQTGSRNVNLCRSGHGQGACLRNGDEAYNLVTQTVTTPPTAYAAPTMKEDLSTAWGTAASIPIPTLQASYYPGVLPVSKAPGQ